MRWLMAVMAMVGAAAEAQPAPPTAPVEVMVLGTYHFDNPGRDLHNPKADDVLQPHRQRELEAIVAALSEFRPTKVMVERVAKTPDLIDARYADFDPAELGKNRDERVQLAYRLARRLGLNSVYAIDEQPGPGEPDYFPFDKVAAWAKANGSEAKLNSLVSHGAAVVARIEQLQNTGTLADVLADLNAPARTERDQSFYYGFLELGDTDHQPGADLNAMWYLRNAKIFAKLQRAAQPGDRVLVVYGAGHNYWLRHFASTAAGYRSVDPVPFLIRAAQRSR